MAKGGGLGLAAHYSFVTYVAVVVEARVDEDGVFLGDPDEDGDTDVVTGWEESGITYLYTNPCNPPDPQNPTSCTNPGAVRKEWATPYRNNFV